MKHIETSSVRQRGFLLIEALVALLIFSLGVLGLIAMGSTAVSAQSDAHFRTDAAKLADDIVSTISLSVDRTTPETLAASLTNFQYQPAGTDCGAFSGGGTVDPIVTAWVAQVTNVGQGLPGLPGSGGAGQQILIDTSSIAFNKVQVTVCWKSPGPQTAWRKHTVVGYVN